MPVQNHFQVFVHLVGHCVKCGSKDIMLFSIGNRLGWVILYIKSTGVSVCPGSFQALPGPLFFCFFFFLMGFVFCVN